MDLGIAGKWALVCGASKGLGFGCAQALVHEGVNVVIVARTADTLEQAARQLIAERPASQQTKVQHLAVDITTDAGRSAVFDHAAARGISFDIVVTNAGGPPAGDFRDWNRDDWIKAVDANMLTPIELMKATVDGMAARGFGRIVNITSNSVKAPIDVLGLSNGARSGLTGFVAGLARSSVAASNVTINNLLPGLFATERLKKIYPDTAEQADQDGESPADQRRRTIPARRFGNAEEFGAICAFLCSQHASYITGQNILADGGAYPGSF
jgi:3-oxoacyl-[acyl-carrier protein] reductase